jgi:hypothetical protein
MLDKVSDKVSEKRKRVKDAVDDLKDCVLPEPKKRRLESYPSAPSQSHVSHPQSVYTI